MARTVCAPTRRHARHQGVPAAGGGGRGLAGRAISPPGPGLGPLAPAAHWRAARGAAGRRAAGARSQGRAVHVVPRCGPLPAGCPGGPRPACAAAAAVHCGVCLRTAARDSVLLARVACSSCATAPCVRLQCWSAWRGSTSRPSCWAATTWPAPPWPPSWTRRAARRCGGRVAADNACKQPQQGRAGGWPPVPRLRAGCTRERALGLFARGTQRHPLSGLLATPRSWPAARRWTPCSASTPSCAWRRTRAPAGAAARPWCSSWWGLRGGVGPQV
jgi:hypothetical protein